MSPSHVPPEVSDAVRVLDEQSVEWPEAVRESWKKVRGFVRARHRDSQRALPAMSLVAQEVVESRNHAQRAIDAMSGIFGHQDDPPDTDKFTLPTSEEPHDE